MHHALALRRGVERSWQVPLPIDSLLNYNMLAGCFFCLFVSIAHFTWFWSKVLESSTPEIGFPLIQATNSEVATAMVSPASGVIEVQENGGVIFDGRPMGLMGDPELNQLVFALQSRHKEQRTNVPVVVNVSREAKHDSIVKVISALERARTHDFVLLFTGSSVDDVVWRGSR